MIQAKFGLMDIAVRTMEVYTTATLEATLAPTGAAGARVAGDDGPPVGEARASYRRVVYETLGSSTISMPRLPSPSCAPCTSAAGRRAGAAAPGVEGLRAIPWQFAWTQTRLLLASWLGVEDALAEATGEGRRSAAEARCTRSGRSSSRRSI